MKRFFDKKSNKKHKKNAEPCMEDLAKAKIRQKIFETGFKFGISLNLYEENDEKRAETPDEAAFRWVYGEEGFRPTQYPDPKLGKNAMTIGYGTLVKNPELKKWAQECFGDQCDDFMRRVNDPKGVITEPEARRIATHSVMSTYKPRTEKLIPNLAQYPADVQGAMISSVYRGSLSGSPKTVALINAGEYEKAASEYLDNTEYRAAKLPNSGFAGVASRMEREAEAIKSLAPTKPTQPTPTAPATTQPTATKTNEYKIEPGDTLSAISKKTGKSVSELTAANKLKNPNSIKAGQSLIIP